jgi:hypothetical protein
MSLTKKIEEKILAIATERADARLDKANVLIRRNLQKYKLDAELAAFDAMYAKIHELVVKEEISKAEDEFLADLDKPKKTDTKTIEDFLKNIPPYKEAPWTPPAPWRPNSPFGPEWCGPDKTTTATF